MMTEQILTTLITAGQAVTLGLIGLIGIRLGKVKTDVARVKTDAAAARSNSAAAREQVENSHETNMREENDSRHAETEGWIDALRRTVTGEIRNMRSEVGKDIGGIRQELRDDRKANNEAIRALDGRVTIVEREKP